MGSLPVLKPREVAALLARLGFRSFGSGARITSTAILTGGAMPTPGLAERPQGNSGPHCSIAVSVGGMVSGSKRQTWSDER